MRDFKVLIYLDFLKLKNNILEIFKNPLQFIKKAFGIIYFIAMACLILFSFKVENKEVKIIDQEILMTVSVGLGIVAIILVLCVLSNLFSDFTPSNFILSDIQYLFPSPVDNKKILLYSLVKSSLKGVLGYILAFLFFILVIMATFGSGILEISILTFGVFFIFMFFMSLGYLIFSIRVKFSLDRQFKKIYYGLNVAIVLFIVVIAYLLYSYNFNINEASTYLYNNILYKLPFVSSMVVIAISILPNTNGAVFLHSSILLACTIVNFVIFFMLKVDYYEAIAEKVEEKDARIKEIKAVKYKSGKDQMDSNIKKVNFKVRAKERNGVMALFWKNSIMRKRRSTPIKKYLLYLVNVAVGGGVAYFTYTEKSIIPIMIIALATVYVTLIFSAMTELYRELKTLYIHLIPGRPIGKIIGASLDELLTLAFRILIMTFPGIILASSNRLLAIIILLVTLTACAFLKLQSLVLVFVLPNEPTSPPMLYMLYTMIVVAIPVAIGMIIFGVTSNYYLALALVELVLIIYIALVLFLCEKLFEKIQY